MMRELVCMCEHRFRVDMPELVDLASEPGREEEIHSGSFMSTRCPRCGKVLKPELEFRVRDATRGLDLYHVPSLDRERYLAGRMEGVPKDAQRVVIGFAELQEKLRIADAGLDDRVVEIVKFHLMRRGERETTGGSLAIRFSSRGGGVLTFDVYGLREGEVGKVRVPEEQATRIAADLPRNLRREPYRSFVAGPYVSCFAVTEGEPENGRVEDHR